MNSLSPARTRFALLALALALLASTWAGLLVGLFLVGLAASAISPAIQTRLMDVAGDSPTMAAAVNHSALNMGNSLGAFRGGAVIAAGFGYVAPTWVGLALIVPGVICALAGWFMTHGDVPHVSAPPAERLEAATQQQS